VFLTIIRNKLIHCIKKFRVPKAKAVGVYSYQWVLKVRHPRIFM